MKRFLIILLIGIGGISFFSKDSTAQGDLAVYETFTQYAPAVFSINVEIPREIILERYKDSLRQLRTYQESFNDMVQHSTKANIGFNQFDQWFSRWEEQIETVREQWLRNNRVRGAGFAVDQKHLVTLSTIIQSATLGGNITITSDYKSPLKAEIRGADQMTGIAVLRIKEGTFSHYVSLKENIKSSLPIASYIMSIQRPYDLPASPFSGMIGGYNRRTNKFELERYIQTDIPLYPGNEGSPVFSPSGKLIGMLATDYYMGRWPSVTFMIPSEMIADSALSIIEHGKRERGWIPGLELRQSLGGILLEEVEEESLADRSGFQKGDLIVGVDGQKEKQLWDLIYYILNSHPEQTLRFEVRREGKPEPVYVEVTTEKRSNT